MNTFDLFEGGRLIVADATAEGLVRVLWARWHARQGTFGGEAFELPERLRFEVDGLTVIEQAPPSRGGPGGRPGVRVPKGRGRECLRGDRRPGGRGNS